MTQPEKTEVNKSAGPPGRAILVAFIGVLVLIAAIITTVIIAQYGISGFITNNLRYILSIEIIILAVYFIEVLALAHYHAGDPYRYHRPQRKLAAYRPHHRLFDRPGIRYLDSCRQHHPWASASVSLSAS